LQPPDTQKMRLRRVSATNVFRVQGTLHFKCRYSLTGLPQIPFSIYGATSRWGERGEKERSEEKGCRKERKMTEGMGENLPKYM